MAELFETFDEAGKPTGLVERSVVHAKGLWHRAAHVWLFTSDGRLHVQRRAADKDLYPNLWDFSVGEHLTPGESFEDGARRGLREELNVTDVILEPIGEVRRMRLDAPELGILDFELQQGFRACHDGPIVADPGEVSEVRLVSLDELATWLDASPHVFTPWFMTDVFELGIIAR